MSKSLQDMCELRDCDLLEVFNELEKTVEVFLEELRAEHLFIKLVYESDRKAINVACEALGSHIYGDEQAGRELIQQPGVIFIPHKLVDTIHKVNNKKSDFLSAVQKFKEQSDLKSNEGILNQLRKYFLSAGLGRVHLKQCERQFTVLENLPKKLTWYTESGGWGAQKKLSKSQALVMVEKVMTGNEDGQRVCRNLINAIADDEVLVKRSKSADSIRVNALYSEGDARPYIGSLPLFVPASRSEIENVTLEMERAESKKHRSRKNTSKFECEPYIESLKLYRYKKAYR
ncbi:hypothetical protein OCT63_20520 [Vibrio sp. RW]|uniref:hypothetical protein n=1 Tax=Vibrio sp. RW TaxID=2998833 RepID=UPI0022CD2ABB|nr:hypothetical protein [Vibrio sp. RW]MDA0146610.1 hypothetical protein [Vibrio sp. RW]